MSQELRARVVAEAFTWLETPYHHHGRIKGVGVDCAMLLAEVYEACCLVPHTEFGHYPQQWNLHHTEERFIGWLLQLGAREVEVPGLGDVAVFKFGRTFSHGAIVVGPGEFIHAHGDSKKVVPVRITEHPLQGRPVRYFTLIGEAS